ncbi:HAMP domain-containing sensor histidine kinase [Cohnella caldifontis]|uniref:HAMP domain-containing sensor histidine kinase n=1 Tax=Cohnella caldifontis TaxID=3027471 RepID=UPI0023EC3DBE|nr:HAMP domain-containing sensor histidine kinase [Cohnella sp. YIM B05605]
MKRLGLRSIGRWRQRHLQRHEELLASQEAYFLRRIQDPNGKVEKPRTPWRWFVAGAVFIHVSMIVVYLLANWIMAIICRTWFPDMGYPIGRQILTAFLMVNLFGGVMMLIRLVFDPGRQQIKMFISWIHAMRRISKGDYDVKLDADPRRLGQMGVLVKNFNEMVSNLSQMERMRQEFISNVSHEFQSPLTSIGGFARALRSEGLTPETRQHYLRIIEFECARLSKLSDNLLKLTSLESNRHPFEPQSFRLDRQIRRVILSCEPQWQAKKLEFDVDLAETVIAADPDLLNQVWTNLIHNAVKFTPEGGTIGVRLSECGDFLEAEISDTGIGVSEEDLPHLFERFFKADKARSRSAGGSGLGLSIVKKIVEMHGGEVTAHSRPGEGMTFRVRLPRSIPAAAGGSAPSESGTLAGATGGSHL